MANVDEMKPTNPHTLYAAGWSDYWTYSKHCWILQSKSSFSLLINCLFQAH